MAMATLRRPPTVQWLEEALDAPNDPISDDNIPLLLEEIRRNYDVNEDAPEQGIIQDPGEQPNAVLNEAINNLEAVDDTVTSCVYCSKEERVEDVRTLARGQHLSMPGQYLTRYDRSNRQLNYAYKHHAIIKEVTSVSGMTATMELIHFSRRDGILEINQTTEVFDLRTNEIYHVQYPHPRYEPDEIVRRAESQLPENRMGESQFESYDLFSNNCEHFATWCVVGEGYSFQVEGLRQKILNALNEIFEGTSWIIQGLTRMLFNSADEIASSMTNAIRDSAIVLGATAAIYLIYCIVMTVLHVKKYRRGQMCRACLIGKLQDLWLTFSVFGVTSVLTFVIIQFALPLLGLGPFGVPLAILLVILSTALQSSVPKIRQSLQSPFNVDKKQISTLSSVDIGEIISFYYYGFEHIAVVTEVNAYAHLVKCVHYALPSLFGTRIVKEETFNLNPSNHTVKLFDCRHLPCKPRHEVVEHVRKRVNETKWSLLDRSDHLCYWAKVQAKPRGSCESTDGTASLVRTSVSIRYEDVHVITDLQLGDVVVYHLRGILVGIRSLDQNYGRSFQIEMMVYDSSWYIRKVKYKINLNKDALSVEIYHPAHCYPMSTRVARARAIENTKPEWWTTKSFIYHCIMRHQL